MAQFLIHTCVATTDAMFLVEEGSQACHEEFQDVGHVVRAHSARRERLDPAEVLPQAYSPSCFLTRLHPRTVHMSLEVQGHRPASPISVTHQKKNLSVLSDGRMKVWN